MTPRFITFDCAGTLIDVRCGVDRLLVSAIQELAPGRGFEAQLPIFQAMYLARLPQFHAANLTRDPAQGRAHWVRLASDWLVRIGEDPALGDEIVTRVDQLAFEAPSSMFELFEDTLPTLNRLSDRGVTMAILSNWDYSLHRVVDMFGLAPFFSVVIASLEEGMEKPDARLFEIALERLGAVPEETVHVGDHPLDDVEGALGVGIRPVLLDRSGATGDAIRSLSEIEAMFWND